MPAAGDPAERASVLVRARSPEVTATIETPEQALSHVEAHRVRSLMIGMTVASALTAGLVLLLGGDPVAARVHSYALAGSAVITATYAVVFRDPSRYRPFVALFVVLLTVPVLMSGYYFWGVFSAYAAVVPLTIFVTADATQSARQAVFGVAICVVAQVAFSLATVYGWIETRSLVRPVFASHTTQLVAIGLIQMLTIGAAALGREVKQRTKSVLDDHNRALRILAQREAQLAEAHAEAVEARKAGGGGPGRFTEQTIGGFLLGEVLGRGSMGEVYAATRVADGMQCAVKLLATHLLRNPSAYDRFQREAAILLTLQSPHVVRVLAVSTSDAPLPFLAMERLDGIDLARFMKETPIMTTAQVVEIISQVASGLDAAHRAGVIHRDLKPQNVFAIGAPGPRTWKILDFGIAKWADSEGSLTKDNILGTPGYMSPEQAIGDKVDERSDIYALGVLLYRLVTGVPAVYPGEVPKMLHEVVYKMPVQPSQITDVSPQIEAVLAVALAKSPADRFATTHELAAALADAAGARLSRVMGHRAARIIAKSPWGAWTRR